MAVKRIKQLFSDFCRAELSSGVEVDVIIDGNRYEDGCLYDTQFMTVVFRNLLHERRFSISSCRWDFVNAKYCQGRLDIF
jgi:hypothetical protein